MGSKVVYLWGAAVCASTAGRSLSGRGFPAGGPLTGRPRYTYNPGPVARYTIVAVSSAGLIYFLFRFVAVLKSK